MSAVTQFGVRPSGPMMQGLSRPHNVASEMIRLARQREVAERALREARRRKVCERLLSEHEGTAEYRLRQIIDATAAEYGTTRLALVGKCCIRKFVHARWDAMWRCRNAGATLSTIGCAFGGRDHTSVLHGVRRWEAMRAARGEE